VEVGIEQAHPVPGGRGDGEGGELLGGRQQRQELGTGGLKARHHLRQHARGEDHVVVDQQGEAGVRKGREDGVPAGGDPLVAEGPGHPHPGDAGGGLPLQPGQQPLEFIAVGQAGADAVVDDGEGLDGVVEAVDQALQQIGAVEDRNPQQGDGARRGAAGGDAIQPPPEVVDGGPVPAEGGVLGQAAPEVGIGEIPAAGGGGQLGEIGLLQRSSRDLAAARSPFCRQVT
jgi:hypothetical protein